jgi:tol-pal system protein YbgF
MSAMRINLILVMCGVITLAGCASNSDVNRLERRVKQLETANTSLRYRIDQLKTDVGGQAEKDNNLSNLYADQDAQFDRFRDDIRKINGRFEETENRFNRDIQSLKDSLKNTGDAVDEFTGKISVNETRIKNLENVMGVEAGEKFDAKAKSLNPDKDMSESELYKVAKHSYDRGDYETARQGFVKFVKKYPKSDMADNARFWAGEIYFNEGWFQKAILEYEKVIKEYPKGNKVPGAYLKQGISFRKLGEKANARLILNELITKFPDSNEAKIARQKVSQIE